MKLFFLLQKLQEFASISNKTWAMAQLLEMHKICEMQSSQEPMSGMPDMTPTSLAAAAAPRTGKIVKSGFRVFERREMVYYTLHLT